MIYVIKLATYCYTLCYNKKCQSDQVYSEFFVLTIKRAFGWLARSHATWRMSRKQLPSPGPKNLPEKYHFIVEKKERK